jgi:hypothetical protein
MLKYIKILSFLLLLLIGLCSIPMLISENNSSLTEKEKNIVWLSSSCVTAGEFVLKDSVVRKNSSLIILVQNAIDRNKKILKEFEERKDFNEAYKKGEKQGKNYSDLERGILLRNAC